MRVIFSFASGKLAVFLVNFSLSRLAKLSGFVCAKLSGRFSSASEVRPCETNPRVSWFKLPCFSNRLSRRIECWESCVAGTVCRFHFSFLFYFFHFTKRCIACLDLLVSVVSVVSVDLRGGQEGQWSSLVSVLLITHCGVDIVHCSKESGHLAS